MRALINSLLELITVLALIVLVLFLISTIIFYIQQFTLRHRIRKAAKQLKQLGVKDLSEIFENMEDENIERTDDKW